MPLKKHMKGRHREEPAEKSAENPPESMKIP